MINQINKFINKFVNENRVKLMPWLFRTSTFIVVLLLLAFILLDVLGAQDPLIKYGIFLLFVIFFVKNDISDYFKIRSLQHMYNEFLDLNKITEALRSTMNLDSVLNMVLSNLTKELHYERAMIFLTSEQKEKIFLKGEIGHGVPKEVIKQQSFELDESIGIIPRTAIEKKPFIIKDAKNDHRCEQQLVEILNLTEFATFPLIVRNDVLGVLVVIADGSTKKEISNEDLTVLDIFANQSAIAIQNARFYERIEQLSFMDELTGLFNHRYFQEKLIEEFNSALEFKRPLSLIYFDIDDFKYYNDTFGHMMGDSILRNIGHIVKSISKETDTSARYGGEEFAVILPDVSKEAAKKLSEELRIRVEDFNFEYKKINSSKNLTVSIGVSSFPEDTNTSKVLLQKADDRLYAAKRSGKNKVVLE